MTELMTREKYMLIRAMLNGANIWLAKEAVASTALSHQEWNMAEQKTWREWERSGL